MQACSYGVLCLQTGCSSDTADCALTVFSWCRDPTPIIRPEWIVDSLNAGEVLPVRPFCSYQEMKCMLVIEAH